jgi:hypothetical protein
MDSFNVDNISFVNVAHAREVYVNAKNAKRLKSILRRIELIIKLIDQAVNSEPPVFTITAYIDINEKSIIGVLESKGYTVKEKPYDYSSYNISWNENSTQDEGEHDNIYDVIPDASTVYKKCIENKELQGKKYIYNTLNDINNKIKEQLKNHPHDNLIDYRYVKLPVYKDVKKVLHAKGYDVHYYRWDKESENVVFEISW